MRKRILHICQFARDAMFQMSEMSRQLHIQNRVHHIKKPSMVILAGEEEHFWMTKDAIERGYLRGQIIDEYVHPSGYCQQAEDRLRRNS